MFGFTKAIYNLITKLFILHGIQLHHLSRFFEIVVSLFDGINKSFGHPWEGFSVREHSMRNVLMHGSQEQFPPIRQTLIDVIWY